MKKEVLDFHAKFCKTFSNAKRLQILCLLKSGERPAGYITKELGVAKANAAQHLAVMRKMRILKTRRDGTTIYYRIINNKISEACSLMQNALEQLMDGVPVVKRQK